MRRGPVGVVAAVVVALIAGVGAGALLFGGDDDEAPADDDDGVLASTTTEPSSSSTTSTSMATSTSIELGAPPTVAVEDLTGEARALGEAINRAAGLTYHAVFQGTLAARGGVGGGGQLTVEVWRRPPDARRDSTITAADQELHTREFRLGDELIGCVRVGRDQPLQCSPNPSAEADPAAPLFGTVDPSAGQVTARDADVGGVPARCYTVLPTTGAPQEACFDNDGVPVVIDGGDGRLERSSVDTVVGDDAFVVPP